MTHAEDVTNNIAVLIVSICSPGYLGSRYPPSRWHVVAPPNRETDVEDQTVPVSKMSQMSHVCLYFNIMRMDQVYM